MKLVLGTVKDGKLVSEVLVPEKKTESVVRVIQMAYDKADEVFGRGRWRVKQDRSLYGGYIVSTDPITSGDTITIE